MHIQIECYGASQRWCGNPTLALSMHAGACTRDVLDRLSERFPEMAARREQIAVARADEIIALEATLVDGDVLALIPPVSGG